MMSRIIKVFIYIIRHNINSTEGRRDWLKHANYDRDYSSNNIKEKKSILIGVRNTSAKV